VAFAVLSVLAFAPWNHLVSANALPDTFGIALLHRVGDPAVVVTFGAIVLLALAVVLSRRRALVIPALVLALLVASSVEASDQIASAVSTSRHDIVGSPANWIDRAANGEVAYVYDGEAFWNSAWYESFWNRKIDRVLSVRPALVPGPIPQTSASPAPDGSLPLHERYVVASNRLTFIGTPVANLTQTNLDVSGLTLWRLQGPPRLSTVTHSVFPNGDIEGQATVDVYDCARGSLELTVLPKSTTMLRVLFDGLPALSVDLTGRRSWSGSIPVRPESQATECRYTIIGGSLLGTTRIAFDRG
jgi:hypothetical protein